MKNAALVVAGLFFLFVAVLHVVRYSKGWEIVVNHFTVPIDWSIYGVIVSLVLALWMFAAAKR